jgi:hypothetical protein
VNAASYFEADFVERLAEFRRSLPSDITDVVHGAFSTPFCMNTKPQPSAKETLASYREGLADGVDAWPVW